MLMMFPVILLLTATLSHSIGQVESHEESGVWSCDSQPEIRLQADFRPGVITLDGHIQDWKDIEGSEFSLLPALDPDVDKEYRGGEMTIKALHDGSEVFFMLQVDGSYTYLKGDSHRCASVALMFQIGENATYYNMGGCSEAPDTCTSKTCHGHEVDIMHFATGNAIPGRLYGSNPLDNINGNRGNRFGHLEDVYAWNPHCRYLDGMGPSGNVSATKHNWKGVWWHSSFTRSSGFVEEDNPYGSEGQSGAYYFEFSRPFRTMDRLQQDVQFTIGRTSKVSVAFWYPEDGKPWHASGHYSIGCDWIGFDVLPSEAIMPTKDLQKNPWDVAMAFSLLFSVVAFCLSVFVGHRFSSFTKSKDVFIPLDTF
ncbi:uncharacterized protein LOC124916494 [Impatiens glandulifera]|uniref:uncharacterized protein LOC124916494 n=1 Tax=Impatiens glandulifera TaxID=253017 RepID=UPI001FB11215|nr:uncharacterized protein LOC124916494 [Impatiens glandulifera]